MFRVLIVVGWVVWVGTIIASAAINYLAGYQFGRDGHEAQVFAVLGVSADAWKAIGPVFIVSLWRAKRRLVASISVVVWLFCFLFAVSAALGLAAQNRSAMVGKRETVRYAFETATAELAGLERQRALLAASRSPMEIESAIAAALARPAGERGTVGSLSQNCSADNWRTRGACAQIAEMRVELATAREARRLDDRIAELKSVALNARERGGALDADPQAVLISRLSLGTVAAADVSLWIVLLLAAMVELVSAFAPLVLHESAAMVRKKKASVAARRGRSRTDGAGRDTIVALRPEGDVFEYLSSRIAPDPAGRLTADALFADYAAWCDVQGSTAIQQEPFFAEVDRIIRDDLSGKVQRDGATYRGLRLSGSESLPRAAARGSNVRGKNSL